MSTGQSTSSDAGQLAYEPEAAQALAWHDRLLLWAGLAYALLVSADDGARYVGLWISGSWYSEVGQLMASGTSAVQQISALLLSGLHVILAALCAAALTGRGSARLLAAVAILLVLMVVWPMPQWLFRLVVEFMAYPTGPHQFRQIFSSIRYSLEPAIVPTLLAVAFFRRARRHRL